MRVAEIEIGSDENVEDLLAQVDPLQTWEEDESKISIIEEAKNQYKDMLYGDLDEVEEIS